MPKAWEAETHLMSRVSEHVLLPGTPWGAALSSTIIRNNEKSSHSWTTACVPSPALSILHAFAPLSLTTP